jgi:cobalt-zinc-cadmium efflux system protein
MNSQEQIPFNEHPHSHPIGALKAALWIASIFMVVELIGGWIASSLALISDALHLFIDVGAFLLSLIALHIAKRPSNPQMSYGYDRAEILGALASALSLWVLSALLIYEALLRFASPQPVRGPIVFFIATIGLIANIFMMRTLHSHHGHNINVKAAYLHVIGDLLGSVGVILAGAILWWTGWNPIDPLITILFTCLILYSSGKIIKQTIGVLMESSPWGVDPIAIFNDLKKLPGVQEVHDLHVWSVSIKKTALSVHLVTKTPQETLNAAHLLLEKKHAIHHMTIQVEDPASFEPRFCYDCEIKGQ